MRIAIASAGIGYIMRGIEVWAVDTAEELRRRGCEVFLCRGSAPAREPYERVIRCLRRDSGLTEWLVKRAPKRFFWRLGLGSNYALEQTTFAMRLLPFLRANKIDIVHVQETVVARWVQWARRRGIVRTKAILGHGSDESLEFLRQFDYLQHLAPIYLERAKANSCWKPTWTAIPNFVDTDRFMPRAERPLRSELGIPNDAVVVMTSAAIIREVKRVDRVIQEFGRLVSDGRHPNAWLLVAGAKTADTAALIAEARELIGDRVRFLVDVAPRQMPGVYNCADVFVLASDREMMPIALLEATASGLPCLVNKHAVMEWMVGPGGYSVDMAPPGALADSLSTMIENANQRATLGSAARQHCVANFSKVRVVDQFLDYYQQVLQA